MLSRIAWLIVVVGCQAGCSSPSESSNSDAGTHASDAGLSDGASGADSGRSDTGSTFAGTSDGSADVSRPFASCASGGPGMNNCGLSQESCCKSLEVESGTYYRTYDFVDEDGSFEEEGGATLAADGGPSGEADRATVSGFRLDKY